MDWFIHSSVGLAAVVMLIASIVHLEKNIFLCSFSSSIFFNDVPTESELYQEYVCADSLFGNLRGDRDGFYN